MMPFSEKKSKLVIREMSFAVYVTVAVAKTVLNGRCARIVKGRDKFVEALDFFLSQASVSVVKAKAQLSTSLVLIAAAQVWSVKSKKAQP